MTTAVVVGAGPNGLAAAVRLAQQVSTFRCWKPSTRSGAAFARASSPFPESSTTIAPRSIRSLPARVLCDLNLDAPASARAADKSWCQQQRVAEAVVAPVKRRVPIARRVGSHVTLVHPQVLASGTAGRRPPVGGWGASACPDERGGVPTRPVSDLEPRCSPLGRFVKRSPRGPRQLDYRRSGPNRYGTSAFSLSAIVAAARFAASMERNALAGI